MIAKPGDNAAWHHVSFPGKAKVHLVQDRAELAALLRAAGDAGYQRPMIVQEYVPGDDAQYADHDHLLRPHGRGAHGLGWSRAPRGAHAGDAREPRRDPHRAAPAGRGGRPPARGAPGLDRVRELRREGGPADRCRALPGAEPAHRAVQLLPDGERAEPRRLLGGGPSRRAVAGRRGAARRCSTGSSRASSWTGTCRTPRCAPPCARPRRPPAQVPAGPVAAPGRLGTARRVEPGAQVRAAPPVAGAGRGRPRRPRPGSTFPRWSRTLPDVGMSGAGYLNTDTGMDTDTG